MSDSRSISSGFYVLVTGHIDGCQMGGYDNLYVKYSFNKGHDWSVLAGVEHGVSQISKRSSASGSSSDVMTWNYPLDIMFRSSNVHGWPQVVIGVYGLTAWGGDVIRGYGCIHVPSIPGRYVKYVPLYTPVSSSPCQRLTAWLTNNPPEFFDSKFIAQGKGREVTRVRSHGCVKITFNVSTKNMSEWGYQVKAERTGDLLHSHQLLSNGGGSDERPASANNPERLSARGQQVQSKTQLSASTNASIANRRAASLANPPSGSNSREGSVVRRGASLAARDGGLDNMEEEKYGGNLSNRSPTLKPSERLGGQSMEPASLIGGSGFGLAALSRQGSKSK